MQLLQWNKFYSEIHVKKKELEIRIHSYKWYRNAYFTGFSPKGSDIVRSYYSFAQPAQPEANFKRQGKQQQNLYLVTKLKGQQ
jgi:hypothetical protein